uniref:AGC-kinase C-terminal domain-containing protein n=1 Tax=Steinernema glaseri TaxID=37863 RepID=A0A1I7ZJC5_9BILA
MPTEWHGDIQALLKYSAFTSFEPTSDATEDVAKNPSELTHFDAVEFHDVLFNRAAYLDEDIVPLKGPSSVP